MFEYQLLAVAAALTGTLGFILREDLADAYQSRWRPLTPRR